MTTTDVGRLALEVLWGAFLLAAAFGALVQRTNFCTMGAVADVVSMGDWTRMRQWALAAAVATLGFAGLAAAGVLGADRTLYASPRWLWLSALSGGAVFGFGMVLASGCASKLLVRIGGGNLKALVVALVAGIAGFATLKGLTAVWRTATVDRVGAEFARNADLGTLLAGGLGIGAAQAATAAGVAVGGALLAWVLLGGRDFVRPANIAAGAGVGLLVLGMWWLTGGLGHVAEHPETLEETFLATQSRRAEGFSFVSPIAYALDWLMFYSDATKRLTVGVVSVAGVIAGSAAMALVRRSFRWEGFGDTSDLGHHLAGGVLMGVGGVTAMGCTIGQGVTGISTLTLTSFTAVAAMIAGAVAGVKYQMWRLERQA
jgi:hypothetical protein